MKSQQSPMKLILVPTTISYEVLITINFTKYTYIYARYDNNTSKC